MKPVICSSPSKPMFEASKAVINSTAMSFSACVLPFKECPNSGKDKENHIWCIRDFKEKSCPLGYDYMCGKEKSGYLVEGCFERSSCPIGTANEIKFNPDTKEASLLCEECPKDLIQPWSHDSSRIFRPGCQQNRVPLYIHAHKDRMKMVHDGHPREEDQYICDTSQGYSDISGHLLCNANTLCTCEKKVVCQNHLELLPDGKCEPKCAEKRVWPDFSCDKFVSEDSTSIPPSSTGATSSGENLHGTAPDSTQGSADATPLLQSSDGGGFAVGYIILIAVGAIVVVMIVIGAVVYCCKKRTRPRQNQSIEEEQDELLEMLPNNGIRPECNRDHEPNLVNNNSVNKDCEHLDLLPDKGTKPEYNKDHETNLVNNTTVNKRMNEKTIFNGTAIKAENAKYVIIHMHGMNHKTNEEEDQGRNQERDQEMDQRRDQEMDQRRDQETDLEMDQRRDQEMDQRRNQRRDQEMDQGRDQEMVERTEGDGEEQPESSNMDDQTAVKAIYAPEGVAQPEMQYLK